MRRFVSGELELWRVGVQLAFFFPTLGRWILEEGAERNRRYEHVQGVALSRYIPLHLGLAMGFVKKR